MSNSRPDQATDLIKRQLEGPSYKALMREVSLVPDSKDPRLGGVLKLEFQLEKDAISMKGWLKKHGINVHVDGNAIVLGLHGKAEEVLKKLEIPPRLPPQPRPIIEALREQYDREQSAQLQAALPPAQAYYPQAQQTVPPQSQYAPAPAYYAPPATNEQATDFISRRVTEQFGVQMPNASLVLDSRNPALGVVLKLEFQSSQEAVYIRDLLKSRGLENLTVAENFIFLGLHGKAESALNRLNILSYGPQPIINALQTQWQTHVSQVVKKAAEDDARADLQVKSQQWPQPPTYQPLAHAPTTTASVYHAMNASPAQQPAAQPPSYSGDVVNAAKQLMDDLKRLDERYGDLQITTAGASGLPWNPTDLIISATEPTKLKELNNRLFGLGIESASRPGQPKDISGGVIRLIANDLATLHAGVQKQSAQQEQPAQQYSSSPRRPSQ
jgi:hypothetical protein